MKKINVGSIWTVRFVIAAMVGAVILLAYELSGPIKPTDSFSSRPVCLLWGAIAGGCITGFLLVAETDRDKEKAERLHRQAIADIHGFYQRELNELILPGLARPISREEFDRMWGNPDEP